MAKAPKKGFPEVTTKRKSPLHWCDERCVCPRDGCGAPLYYSEFHDQHACSNAKCAWLERRDEGEFVRPELRANRYED